MRIRKKNFSSRILSYVSYMSGRSVSKPVCFSKCVPVSFHKSKSSVYWLKRSQGENPFNRNIESYFLSRSFFTPSVQLYKTISNRTGLSSYKFRAQCIAEHRLLLITHIRHCDWVVECSISHSFKADLHTERNIVR